VLGIMDVVVTLRRIDVVVMRPGTDTVVEAGRVEEVLVVVDTVVDVTVVTGIVRPGIAVDAGLQQQKLADSTSRTIGGSKIVLRMALSFEPHIPAQRTTSKAIMRVSPNALGAPRPSRVAVD